MCTFRKRQKALATAGIRNPNSLVRSLVTIPTKIYRLNNLSSNTQKVVFHRTVNARLLHLEKKHFVEVFERSICCSSCESHETLRCAHSLSANTENFYSWIRCAELKQLNLFLCLSHRSLVRMPIFS